MCTDSLNYKSYQRVLDLGSEKKTKASIREPKPTASKRRTKTGCMTCRRRKKKCDEHRTGGKCQACIRNFLDCHWPGEEEVKKENTESSVPASPQTPESLPVVDKGADAYPSPAMSPKAEHAETTTNCMDIKSLTLPPMKTEVKVTKPKKSTKKISPKKAQGAKFFIASFDSGKSLCQIKS